MLVKNEDRLIWYAISSVLPFVDKIIIFDTGSQDKTVEIVHSFQSKKIHLEVKAITNLKDIAHLRQEQLDKTESDWFWIVDGDEIYPYSLCREILNIIKIQGDGLEGIAVRRYDLLGDIYHYQDETVGTYELFGKKGHLVLRLINKKNLPGLHIKGIYPYEGYYDNKESEIIYHSSEKFYITQGRLFHSMYLRRSTLGSNLSDTFHRRKYKIETGHKMGNSQNFPEVFNIPRPDDIPDVTGRRSLQYELIAHLITPIKVIKRNLFKIIS